MKSTFLNHIYTTFILLFVLTTTLFAENKPYIINFSKKEYKADNKNWSISQDARGVMYFGNDNGLLEFDGVEWMLHQIPKSSIIRSVAAKSHETIFTGGYEQFGRWDRDISGTLIYTSLSDSLQNSVLSNDDFWKIQITDSCVYFQSFNSIFVYDYKTVKRINSDKLILLLSKVRDRLLVQEMQASIFELKGNTLHQIKGYEKLIGTDARVILPYKTNQQIIGTSRHGIYVFDGHELKDWNKELSSRLKADELNCAIYSSQGFYYLGTILNGVYKVDLQGNIIDHISSKDQLQNNTVLALFEDNVGNIWIALDRGISYIRNLKDISSFIDPSGNTGAVYDAALWNNKLFIATNQGAFYISVENLSKLKGLSEKKLIDGTQGQVWSFSVVDGRLFCCHNKGLIEITKDLKTSNPYATIQGTGVYRLSEAQIKGKNSLILSTYSSIHIIDKAKGTSTHYTELIEPISNSTVDHLGNIWLEHSNKGVYKCQLSSNTDSFINKQCYGGDSKDGLPYSLKFFKIGGRIILYGNNKFYTYDDISDKIIPNEKLNECFQSIKNIQRIIPIRDHYFWALTKSSAYKFSYDSYTASILDRCNIAIDNLSMVNLYENISILNDSTSLICLDNGFLLYNSSMHNNNSEKTLPVPFIKAIETKNIHGDKKYLNSEKNNGITNNFNTITFRFSAYNVFADNLSFQYMLKNVDSDWSNIEKINKITYTRLPQGKYTFLLRCVDNLGNISQPISYNFEILPPWYRSGWAYTIYVIIFILIIISFWLMILRHYYKKNRRLQRIWEAEQLKLKNEYLQNEIEKKEAEMLTQTSFIIKKNELILKLKELIDEFYAKNTSQSLAPLHHKINAILNNNLDTEEDWKMFLIKFEQKHTGFFKSLKNKYPELTSNDLKLCACLKLNLDTKEIASLMNLSVRAIENSRYRLRKKLNIQASQNLTDFFLNID